MKKNNENTLNSLHAFNVKARVNTNIRTNPYTHTHTHRENIVGRVTGHVLQADGLVSHRRHHHHQQHLQRVV